MSMISGIHGVVDGMSIDSGPDSEFKFTDLETDPKDSNLKK